MPRIAARMRSGKHGSDSKCCLCSIRKEATWKSRRTTRIAKPYVKTSISKHERKATKLAQHPCTSRVEETVLKIDNLLWGTRRGTSASMRDALYLQYVAIGCGNQVILRWVAVGGDQLRD